MEATTHRTGLHCNGCLDGQNRNHTKRLYVKLTALASNTCVQWLQGQMHNHINTHTHARARARTHILILLIKHAWEPSIPCDQCMIGGSASQRNTKLRIVLFIQSFTPWTEVDVCACADILVALAPDLFRHSGPLYRWAERIRLSFSDVRSGAFAQPTLLKKTTSRIQPEAAWPQPVKHAMLLSTTMAREKHWSTWPAIISTESAGYSKEILQSQAGFGSTNWRRAGVKPWRNNHCESEKKHSEIGSALA